VTPTASASTRAPEIRALSGIRVIPVLLIVLFHYHEWNGYPFEFRYDAIVAKSYLWVEFFFALSGFILFYVYGSQGAELLRAKLLTRFLVTRLSRIYPLQLATLLVVLGMLVWDRTVAPGRPGASIFDVAGNPEMTVGTFLSNLALVHAWNIHDKLTWNAPAWFVSVEAFLYLAFPALLALAGARFGGRTVAVGVASAALLVTLAVTSGMGMDLAYRNGVPRGLADFGIGLFLGALFVEIRRRGARGKPLPSSVHTLAQVAVVAELVAGFYSSGIPRTKWDLMIVVPMYLLIFLLAFDRGLIAGALHARWLRKLGEWSFAIYMVQFIVLILLPFAGLRSMRWVEATLAVLGAAVARGRADAPEPAQTRGPMSGGRLGERDHMPSSGGSLSPLDRRPARRR
jgi:peptidoglycan/LPS O-acetylase OafA/YrhL